MEKKQVRVLFQDIETDKLPPVGYEFYLVGVWFTDQGAGRLDGFSKPQHTNISGEDCVTGWLGMTNNIDREALGKWRVVANLPGTPEKWLTARFVEIEKIGG